MRPPRVDVGRVSLSPDTGTVRTGHTLQLAATVTDKSGSVLTSRRVEWHSADEARATVSQTGLVTGVSPGLARIIAESGGRSDTASVTVLTGWTSIDVAIGVGTHSCALAMGGAAFCWGLNSHGQLGDGTLVSKPRPVPVSGGQPFTALRTGSTHSCGVAPSGAALCWGDNALGRLGAPTGTCGLEGGAGGPCSPTPVPVSGGLRFVAVDAGFSTSCGITASGAAYCWGLYSFGVDGALASAAPVPVPGGRTFRAITVGLFHACGLTADNRAFCWGTNERGELGSGDVAQAGSLAPVAVAGGLTFVLLTAGDYFTCGITTDGAAYCWGSNYFGQLGAGPVAACNPAYPDLPCSRVPVRVAGNRRYTDVSAGGRHACAVAEGGAAYCWGEGPALGSGGSDESSDQSPVPVPVAGGLAFARIAAGSEHSCGVTTDGALYCWGFNGAGHLGNGLVGPDYTSRVPVAVLEP